MAKWTKDDDEMLIAAVSANMPTSRIDVSGHSLKSIHTRMSRLGLHTDRFASKKTDSFAFRKCMPCGKTFGSQHIGNRICPQCAVSLQFHGA